MADSVRITATCADRPDLNTEWWGRNNADVCAKMMADMDAPRGTDYALVSRGEVECGAYYLTIETFSHLRHIGGTTRPSTSTSGSCPHGFDQIPKRPR